MFIKKSRIDFKTEVEQGFWCSSDTHFGDASTNYDLIKWELDQARQNNDRINVNGDIFAGIFPTDRKRFQPSVLHERCQGVDNPSDIAIDMAYEMYEDYADLIDVIGEGNHDTAITKYHSHSPVITLIKRLNQHLKSKNHSHRIQYGGYMGWLGYAFYKGKKFVDSLRITYHHGSGGSAPVSKGMIDFHRGDVFLEGADIVWLGHKHNKIYYKDRVIKLSRDCTTHIIRPRLHILTGAYSENYIVEKHSDAMKTGPKNNYVETNKMAPQGLGGYRVVFKLDDSGFKKIKLEDEEWIPLSSIKKVD